MTVAFWIMVGAAAFWFLASGLVLAGFDSWGEYFLPVALLSGAVAIAAAVVFVILFGLDALGVAISIGSKP
jgi:hypothetical protein